MKKSLLFIINLSIIIIAVLGFCKLLENFNNHKVATATYTELQEISSSDSTTKKSLNETSSINSTENKIETRHEKLSNLNSDYKFWITIENTNINYPVVQGKDNAFYLNNDFYKNPLVYGCIFLDYTTIFNEDFNNILYGHNTKTNDMFSEITKFKKEDFFNQNNKIILEDADYKYIYETFSVYTIKGYDDPAYLYNLNSGTPDNISKSEYLNMLKEKSFFNKNIDLKNTDKIITLITCSYETKNTRTIVHSKLISKEKI